MRYIIKMIGEILIKVYAFKLERRNRDVSAEKVDSYLGDRDLFFILSMGRSGSLFLADLLNQAEGQHVYHEPIRLDFLANFIAYYNPLLAQKYFDDFRKRFIYNQMFQYEATRYGEVNSLLRRHARAIRMEIPSASLIHLVRDGRDVVRSMMARRTFTLRDPITNFIKPDRDDIHFQQWALMTRFEKICWYWWKENQYLMDEIDQFVRFEDIITDYQYLKINLLDSINIYLPEEIWIKQINLPKNITKKHKFPHWTNWDARHLNAFNSICGELMKTLGYSL